MNGRIIRKIYYVFGSLFMLLALFISTQHASAAFVANRLLDDAVFEYSGSMNAAQIDAFLNTFPTSCISTNSGFDAKIPAGYSPTNGFTFGGFVSAGQVIATAAQVYGINPQVLLTTLQKEQSLVAGGVGYCNNGDENKYAAAMGYGCPDSSGPTSWTGVSLYRRNGVEHTSTGATCVNTATKAGFSQQVIRGAWLLKFGEQRSKGNMNWAVIGGSWNNSDDPQTCYGGPMTQGTWQVCPSGAKTFYDGYQTIDGTAVHMDTGATATLYWYTPHFHGNQSFVSVFESWFGSTQAGGYVVAVSDDPQDLTQYVVSAGVKYRIPSPEVKIAWGLQTKASTTMTAANLSAMPTGATLSRLMRPIGNLNVYFVDGGTRWRFGSAQAISAWGFDPATIADVPASLAFELGDQGDISFTIHAPSDNRILLMDGGVLKQFDSPSAVVTWEGDNPKVMAVSTDYFASLTVSGTHINSNLVSNAGTNYYVDSGRRASLTSGQAALFNSWSAAPISTATVNRLAPTTFSHFVQHPGDPTVYLIDNTQKHAVGSPDLLSAWSLGGVPAVMQVTQGSIDLLPTNTAISTFIAQQGSNLYLMSGQKLNIPSGLQTQYMANKSFYSATASLVALYNSGPSVSIFVQAAGQPTVYIMDNGQKRPAASLEDYVLWGGGPGTNTILPSFLADWYPSGTSLGSFISAGATNYLLNRTEKKTVSASIQSDWGLGAPTVVSQALADAITTGTALSNTAKAGSAYYLIQNGTGYSTTNSTIADLWQLGSAPTVDPLNTNRPQQKPLLRFAVVADPNDHRIFVVDSGVLYTLASPAQVYNFGYHGEPFVVLSSAYMGTKTLTTLLQNNILQNSTGTYYAVDNGTRRSFSSNTVRDQWIQSLTIPTVTDGFLAFLPVSGQMTGSIRAGDLAIYGVISGQKRHIQSPGTYNASYAPVTDVSVLLRDSLPTGAPIP